MLKSVDQCVLQAPYTRRCIIAPADERYFYLSGSSTSVSTPSKSLTRHGTLIWYACAFIILEVIADLVTLFLLRLQMAVKNCFIRGSVVRYVQLPAQHVDTQLLEDATRRGAFCSLSSITSLIVDVQCRGGQYQSIEALDYYTFGTARANYRRRAIDGHNG